ncbi:16S rRNA (cytidine(1402)-2'-O)-methyltransferase [uncultured Roseibium sp.]|uniref:16S rRNA (cytidine(1402)-2'-O)-methyltransferase n=1 Tax=uncultured Roseibium sp. TaxID=1936171 RepID=UPI003216D248
MTKDIAKTGAGAGTGADERASRRFIIGEHDFNAPRLEPALYIVATPIGNLGDITVRALETLAAASVIACEDTRVTGTLTHRFGLKTPLMPYHEHNADKQRPKILAALEKGEAVALVSDAGTPLVSDPGYRLVRDVLEAGYKVIPIPGASAPLAGLVGSGLPSDTVLFAGFLPQKGGPKKTRLAELAAIPATVILFESPRRLGATLATMAEIMGAEREAVVARELTKRFETFERGTLAELAEKFAGDPPKGEIVILLGPPQDSQEASEEDAEELLRQALKEMPVSAAAKQVAKQTGLDRNDLYKLALDLKADGG